MPPKRKKIDWEQVFKIAREVAEKDPRPSRAKVARHLTIVESTLNKRAREEGKDDELNAILEPAPHDPGPVPDAPPEPDPGERETLRARQLEEEARVLKKNVKDLQKRLASQEEFFDRIAEICKVRVDKPSYPIAKQLKEKPANSIILPIYDQQFGQFVRPTDTPGNRGGFSTEIFDERLAQWVTRCCKVIDQRARGYRIEELIFVLGGDQVEGDEIFAGQAWQLELDPLEQMFQLSEKMTDALKRVIRFAKESIGIPRIGIYGVTGNHGKVGGKRGGARPRSYSWDYGFLRLLEQSLRAEPVDQFAYELGGSLFFRCAGHEFQAIHGDEIRGWGGLPFYGLSKFDGRSIRLHNRIYRYLLMGHHHQQAEIPNGAGETLISGDWVGANNLSGVITAASLPQQRAIFVSEKLGVAGTERIYLQDAAKAYEPTAIHELNGSS